MTIPLSVTRPSTTMVAHAYEHGKALNVAEHFEIDDVIDPAATRRRLVHALDAAGADRTFRGTVRAYRWSSTLRRHLVI